MKKSVDEILEEQGYSNMKKRFWIAFSILILALIIFAGYFLIFSTRECKDEKCYFDSLVQCKRIYFIREDSQASWFYKIIKSNENSCDVQTKLLKLKEGSIENEKVEGKKMICSILKSSREFPEKRISDCSGPLREQMQEIIIQRMHNYLLTNLGKIKEEFKRF